MKLLFRTILSILIGWLSGVFVNMRLVVFGDQRFPIKAIDTNNFEALVSILYIDSLIHKVWFWKN